MREPGAGEFSVDQMAVREIVTMPVVSFARRLKANSARAMPVFVVDTWQRDDKGWHLSKRHAAAVAGSRRGIPGNSGRSALPKQI